MSGWSPATYVLGGALATREDLEHSASALSRHTESPVLLATFSAYYLLPSLSIAFHADNKDWQLETIHSLKNELQVELRDQEDKLAFVAGKLEAILRAIGVTDPTTLAFGGELARPGKLAVVLCAGHLLTNEDCEWKAQTLAAAALGSRAAVFTRDNSIELSVLRSSRTSDQQTISDPSALLSSGSSTSTGALTDFAREVLGASLVATYETEDLDRSRDPQLHRQAVSMSHSEPPDWLSSVASWLEDKVELPPAPELGGSNFESLDELVSLCVTRQRRLVGIIAAENYAFVLPYGFDHVKSRPVGALCMLWDSPDQRCVGVYEIAVARMVALHLAREYDERRSAESVQLVTSQLRYISALPTDPATDELLACSPDLQGRRDVGLVATSVISILKGLADLSGAMSVACRLIAGSDGPHFTRYLSRLHCEGLPSAADSPAKIDLRDFHESVNAWVATSGEVAYLRALHHDPELGCSVSEDLAAYPGLDRVQVFRSNVQSELCVPIFAERRIVGTVNLEAEHPDAFASTARTVAEYAHLIGIALLESRRRIGVDTVTESEGFLDHRHKLEAGLKSLEESLGTEQTLTEPRRQEYEKRITDLTGVVFMRRVSGAEELQDQVTVAETIDAAMRAIEWGDLGTPLDELMLVEAGDVASTLELCLARGPAQALKFAIGQALHNVRKHGGGGESLLGREHPAMFRLGERVIGGKHNLYLGVSSTCTPERLEGLDPQRVFREPLDREDDDRVALGSYLAGEALRRCGGSAFLRVDRSGRAYALVEAEFSVPTPKKLTLTEAMTFAPLE